MVVNAEWLLRLPKATIRRSGPFCEALIAIGSLFELASQEDKGDAEDDAFPWQDEEDDFDCLFAESLVRLRDAARKCAEVLGRDAHKFGGAIPSVPVWRGKERGTSYHELVYDLALENVHYFLIVLGNVPLSEVKAVEDHYYIFTSQEIETYLAEWDEPEIPCERLPTFDEFGTLLNGVKKEMMALAATDESSDDGPSDHKKRGRPPKEDRDRLIRKLARKHGINKTNPKWAHLAKLGNEDGEILKANKGETISRYTAKRAVLGSPKRGGKRR